MRFIVASFLVSIEGQPWHGEDASPPGRKGFKGGLRESHTGPAARV